MVWLTRLDLHSSYAADVLPPLLVMGTGMGLIFAPAMSLGTAGVAAHDAGVASATVNTSQQVGGSIGTALLNTLATSAATAYWWSAGFYLFGMVLCGLIYPAGKPVIHPTEESGDGAPPVHM